jgi:hypothetical protein
MTGTGRRPFGLAKVRRAHTAGVYVYGWYPRLRGRPVHRRFDPVSVMVDGRYAGACSLLKRALFVPMSTGPHQIALIGDGEELTRHSMNARTEKIVLEFWPTYESFGPLPGRYVERFNFRQLD